MKRDKTVLLDRIARAVALILVVAAIALPVVVKPDGKPHSDLVVLFGRFHPVLLHMPVALLGLVPMLEIAGCFKRWRHVREFAGLTLALGAGSSVLAMLAGYALAYGSGMNDAPVMQHMWGGVALTACAVAATLVRRYWMHHRIRFVYPVLLALTVGTLGWAAHKGGSLTHGETYLTDPLPVPVKKLLGIPLPPPPAKAAADSAYALTVHPIFEHNCLSCHGPANTKGGLRLDDYALLMKGGRGGPAVVAGKPDESELLTRVCLAENDRKVMPPDGKPLLKKDEIDALRAWIAGGASFTAPPAAGVVVPKAENASAFAAVGDYSKLAKDIQKLETKFGVKFVPVSRIPGDGLILRTRSAPARFDDAAFAALRPIAPFVTEAELDGTRVTDAAFNTLTAYTNLRSLNLARTGVTGADIGKLAALKKLIYLNLTDTKLTAAALAQIKGVAHVYAFGSPAVPIPEAPVDVTPQAKEKKPVSPEAKPAAPTIALALTPAVQPVLQNNCIGCHGPTNAKGGLRLDTAEAIAKGGKHGPVFLAGKPAESELLRRIALAATDKGVMPPPNKPRVPADQISALKAWIASAAPAKN